MTPILDAIKVNFPPPDEMTRRLINYHECRYHEKKYVCRNQLYRLKNHRGEWAYVYAKRRGHARRILNMQRLLGWH